MRNFHGLKKIQQDILDIEHRIHWTLMEDIIHLDLEFYSDEKRCEAMGRYKKRWDEKRL